MLFLVRDVERIVGSDDGKTARWLWLWPRYLERRSERVRRKKRGGRGEDVGSEKFQVTKSLHTFHTGDPNSTSPSSVSETERPSEGSVACSALSPSGGSTRASALIVGP